MSESRNIGRAWESVPVMIVSTLFLLGGLTYFASAFGIRDLDASTVGHASHVWYGILYTAAGSAGFAWGKQSRRREKRRHAKRYGIVDSQDRETMADAIWDRAGQMKRVETDPQGH